MTELRERLQESLGEQYLLERELAGGGMSRVFLAHERRLDRKVVVKVLSPELTAGISADRFEREIRVAAGLQQANIVPVLTAGSVNGIPYYTMPFVKGESLRLRLAGGPLSIGEAIGVLRDVAKALAFAHGEGIVHRDIKPDNVLLSGGTAVVTDFGIAKALSAARTEEAPAGPIGTLTQAGLAVGTPAYMAPEQAMGDPADARADLYAFGCMAYELLSGRPPFQAHSAQRLIAAHVSEMARPLAELRPDCPAALAELVARCMAKDPAARPASAASLLEVLDAALSSGPRPAMPGVLAGGPQMMWKVLGAYVALFLAVVVVTKAAIVTIGLPDWVYPGALLVMALGLPLILLTGYVHFVARKQALSSDPSRVPSSTVATMALRVSPHLSWRRTAHAGWLSGAAFVLFIAGFMALRALGIGPAGSLLGAGRLSAREPVLVGAFAASGDTTLGSVVEDAVRAELSQSSAVRLVDPTIVAEALLRMKRPAGSTLDTALAREVAIRQGIKAIVNGSIRQLGTSYLITVRLVGADSGQELASFREQADGQEAIIATIGHISRQLRGKIGESLRDVHASPPLFQVTTGSLDAARQYAVGVRALDLENDFPKGRAALERAIALDSSFAMAYRRLGVALYNRGGEQEASNALLEQAYRNRDRLTSVERDLAVASYFQMGPHPDADSALAAYERVIEASPYNRIALNNAALAYWGRRDLDKAISYFRRSADSIGGRLNFQNLARATAERGNVPAAFQVLDSAVRRFGPDAQWTWTRTIILAHEAQFDSALATAKSGMQLNPGSDPAAYLRYTAASVLLNQGRLQSGLTMRAAARQIDARRVPALARLQAALDSAEVDGWWREDAQAAARRLDRLLASHVLDSVPFVDRPYWRLAYLSTALGRAEPARRFASLVEQQAGKSTRPDDLYDLHSARAMAAFAAKRYDEAIQEWHAADRGRCMRCVQAWIAAAYDLKGAPDSARHYYEEFTSSGRGRSPSVDASFRASSLKRLGELAEQKGDLKAAASWYAQFIELWKGADPELQPKVREVRARLQRLQKGQG